MVFLNGKFLKQEKASISVMDRGFLFADGIYEVIPVYNNKIFRIKEHLTRLNKNLKQINITNPYDNTTLVEILNNLVTKNNFKNQSIYIQITRGTDNKRKYKVTNQLTPTVFIKSDELIPYSFTYIKKGHKAITKDDIRWHRCDIKSISLLASVLYAEEARKEQVEEVILSRDGFITEGASSNIFIIKNNNIITHPSNANILSGITRTVVLELAKKLNLNIKEQPFTKNELYNADEVLISSSTREIMPIIVIDDNPINNGIIGNIFTNLYQQYQLIKPKYIQ